MRLLPLLIAVPLWAAEDADAILRRMVEAQTQNREPSQQYTYREDLQFFDYHKNGQTKKKNSRTYDVLYVEGLQYRRLVARDGKPLSKREEAREEKKMQQTAAERRKQRRSGLFRRGVSLGSAQELLTLFDNRLIGEEEIRGRKAWVIESTPKAGHAPANDHEKEILSFAKKHWIDQTESFFLRRTDTVVGDQIRFKPGTVITFDFDKVNDGAWLPLTTVVESRVQIIKMVKVSGRTESRFSNYKKFDVESTITVDEPK